MAMTITVELPEDIATHEDASREVLEAFALEGFRTEKLTSFQTSQLLGMGRLEFEQFLKARGVTEQGYSLEQFQNDLATSDSLRARTLLTP